MKEEKIIMYESPEAASYVTNIEGWVDINRRFFGKGDDAEHMARWSSCTHRLCDCGGKMERGYTKCSECRRKLAIERYNSLPFKEWEGIIPVCTHNGDEYFFDEEELIDYMEENEMTEINLLFCDPVGYSLIDIETIAGDAYEDWEPNKELCDKIGEFNSFLQSLPPHSWMPSKVRTTYKITENEAS